MAAGKKRIIEGHTPGGPQEKRRKHEERGVHPASVSGLGVALVSHPCAAKKPRNSFCEHQRRRSHSAKTAAATASASTCNGGEHVQRLQQQRPLQAPEAEEHVQRL